MKHLTWLLPLVLLLGFAGCRAAQSGAKKASLSFSSFDGGGPKFSCTPDDPTLVSVESSREYAKKNHAELDGAGYTITFTLTGKKPGQTGLTVTADSPIAPESERRYTVTVDEKLNVTLTESEEARPETNPPHAACVLALETAQYTCTAVFADGPDAEECIRQLNAAAAELAFRSCAGGFSAELPWPQVGQSDTLHAQPGDLVLEGRILTLCTEPVELTGALLAQLGENSLAAVAGTEGEFPALLWLEWEE